MPNPRLTESELEPIKSALKPYFQVTVMYIKIWKSVFYSICVFASLGKLFASIYACGNIAYPYSISLLWSTCTNLNRHNLFCCYRDGKYGETSWIRCKRELGITEMQQIGYRLMEGTRDCILRTCALEVTKFRKPRANQQHNYPWQIPDWAQLWIQPTQQSHLGIRIGGRVRTEVWGGEWNQILAHLTTAHGLRVMEQPGFYFSLTLPVETLSHLKHHSALPRKLGWPHSDGKLIPWCSPAPSIWGPWRCTFMGSFAEILKGSEVENTKKSTFNGMLRIHQGPGQSEVWESPTSAQAAIKNSKDLVVKAFIFLQFWRLEVWLQCASIVRLWWAFSSWFVHISFVLTCSFFWAFVEKERLISLFLFL